MRWIVRFLITWAIMIVIGYFVGLPYAAKYLQNKTKTELMDQCQAQLSAQRLTGGANAPLHPEQAASFCHCLADPITITREDLIEAVHSYVKTGVRQPPARVAAQMKTSVDTCNEGLQRAISGNLPRAAMPPQPVQQPMQQMAPVSSSKTPRGETIIFK